MIQKNKIESKGKLFEMFEKVNKIKLKESFSLIETPNIEKIKNILKNDFINTEYISFQEKDNTISFITSFGRGEKTRLSPNVVEKLRQEFGEVYEDMYDDDDRGNRWEYKIVLNNANEGLDHNITQNDEIQKGDDNPELDSIKYVYDNKGNYIPIGYEDKKVVLRSIEKPLGSGKWKVAVIMLDEFGDMDRVLALKNNWGEARNALHDSIT